MDLNQLRQQKQILESRIFALIASFQADTDLKVRKIHLNLYRVGEKKKKNNIEFVNVIIKSL